MAKLEHPPDIGIIRAFKGSIDFYKQGPNWYVRKWPVIVKPTVLDTNIHNITRFRYHQQLQKLFSPYVIDAWRGMTINTRWIWRDIAYRCYAGTSYNCTGQPNLLIPKNYPFPTIRSPYWAILNAFYRFDEHETNLVFWFDQLVPSVQLVALLGNPLHRNVLKYRRGQWRDCGDDLYTGSGIVVTELEIPGILYPPEFVGCHETFSAPLHSASVKVWDDVNGYVEPFGRNFTYLCVKQVEDQTDVPGSFHTFSAGFFFSFDLIDIEEARAAYDSTISPEPADYPFTPPDPQWRTRQRPPSKRHDLTNTVPGTQPFYAPRRFLELPPDPFLQPNYCPSDCGYFKITTPHECLPDPSPPPITVELTTLTWRFGFNPYSTPYPSGFWQTVAGGSPNLWGGNFPVTVTSQTYNRTTRKTGSLPVCASDTFVQQYDNFPTVPPIPTTNLRDVYDVSGIRLTVPPLDNPPSSHSEDFGFFLPDGPQLASAVYDPVNDFTTAYTGYQMSNNGSGGPTTCDPSAAFTGLDLWREADVYIGHLQVTPLGDYWVQIGQLLSLQPSAAGFGYLTGNLGYSYWRIWTPNSLDYFNEGTYISGQDDDICAVLLANPRLQELGFVCP